MRTVPELSTLASLPPLAPPVTVAVADPHAAMREALPLLLGEQDLMVVASAASGEAFEALVADHLPDVALISLDLADGPALELVGRLHDMGIATVAYVEREDSGEAALARGAGAAAVFAKSRPIAGLADALRDAAHDGTPHPARLDELPRTAADAPPPAPTAPAGGRSVLSGHEARVLQLVSQGLSSEQIASRLAVSPHTVRTHVRNLLRKLGAQSRAHAVAIALRDGVIES